MKIQNRHRPVARETVLDVIGVRRFNGDGGDGGGSGGSGGSGGNGSGGNGGQGSGSGSGSGAGDGGQGSGSGSGDRGGAGGGSGSGSGSGNGGSGAGGGGDDVSRRIESLPQWAQQHIREIRDEAAGNRTKRTAAEAQMTEIQRKVAAAFGIDVDGDGKPDPDKLAADLATAQDKTRQREVELAVYRVAATRDDRPDPNALLDSRSFMDSVADLDPTAQDFTTRLGDKIATAVQNNPHLTVGGSTTGGRPGGGIGQGGRGQQSGPTGVAAGRALHQARKGGQQQNANSTT